MIRSISDKVRGRLGIFHELSTLIGTRAAARWQLLGIRRTIGLSDPERWTMQPDYVQHEVTMRLRGSSDAQVFHTIFIEREYSCLDDLNPKVVVDLGANAGFSSAYFLSRFPEAKVIALEPDDRNAVICRENLAPYGDRAIVLHGAIWSRCTNLVLSRGTFGDGREWATQVIEAPEGAPATVQAWDMPALIQMAGGGIIDLLKVDIERSELFLFDSSSAAWLPKVRNICIELHGEDCKQAFFGALSNYTYQLSHSGELTICRDLRPR